MSLFPSSSHPLTGYHFRVDFGIPGLFTKDVGFKSVSGISMELELKDIDVGGVNSGKVQVPEGVKFGDLVLERGMFTGSALINWFEAQILSKQKIPIPIIVSTLDEDHLPIYSWFFINAFPIKWETDGFNAQQSELLIEKITFRYQFYKQTNMTAASAAFKAI